MLRRRAAVRFFVHITHYLARTRAERLLRWAAGRGHSGNGQRDAITGRWLHKVVGHLRDAFACYTGVNFDRILYVQTRRPRPERLRRIAYRKMYEVYRSSGGQSGWAGTGRKASAEQTQPLRCRIRIGIVMRLLATAGSEPQRIAATTCGLGGRYWQPCPRFSSARRARMAHAIHGGAMANLGRDLRTSARRQPAASVRANCSRAVFHLSDVHRVRLYCAGRATNAWRGAEGGAQCALEGRLPPRDPVCGEAARQCALRARLNTTEPSWNAVAARSFQRGRGCVSVRGTAWAKLRCSRGRDSPRRCCCVILSWLDGWRALLPRSWVAFLSVDEITPSIEPNASPSVLEHLTCPKDALGPAVERIAGSARSDP
ncbi:hypothetical protein PSPO01_12953 [Paraphaeosphaeria sporulosa]